MSDFPRRIDTHRVYDGRLVRVDVDSVRSPDGTEFDLELVRHPGASAVVPLLSADSDDPSVLLLRQFRYAASGTIWEIPAGVLEPGEEPIHCAHRELAEETGATARSMEHLTTIYTTPGFTDERIHLFLATGITPGDPSHERDEFIEVTALPLSRVLAMIRDGELVDGKSVVALLYVAGFRLGL
ncbi:MAG: NUDIX hydrolase [Gemmatimonadales bacterium]